MNRIVKSSISFLLTLVCSPLSVVAITIPTVPVGNAGNAGDPQVLSDLSTGYGAVGYNYRIGTFEVTVGQYTAFLNAIAATDTYDLYDTQMMNHVIAGITRDGEPGSYSYSVIGSANKPVAFVSWGDAARFSNWLHNGQPSGTQDASTTEDGAHTLNGALTAEELGAVSRNPGATWFIPSENEWHKAAYHQPVSQGGDVDNYWAYPARTNNIPYSDQPPGSDAPVPSNTANFFATDLLANGYDDGYAVTGSVDLDFPQNYLTDVGAYSTAIGPYGTFDQGGNLWEWTDGYRFSHFGSQRVRGGSWANEANTLHSAAYNYAWPTAFGSDLIGFRVATVPEPSTAVLAALACGVLLWWRSSRARLGGDVSTGATFPGPAGVKVSGQRASASEGS